MKLKKPSVMRAVCLFAMGIISLSFAEVKSAQAGRLEHSLRQYFSRKQHSQPLTNGSTTQALTFNQRINHKDLFDRRKFEQRYYVDAQYADGPNSPVFFDICGEAVCNANDWSGSQEEYAKKYHAYLISLEHRYYGKSQPFKTLSSENLRYLSTENAIEDLAAFERYAIKKHELRGKWIAFGGSYSGALAAFFRMRHPEFVVGALASSAPVFAKVNFEQYDLDIATVAGSKCLGQIQNVVKKLDDSIANPSDFSAYKATFQATGINDPIDFMSVVADMAGSAIQYGHRDDFCNALDQATDPVASYAAEGLKIFGKETPLDDSFQAIEDTNPATYETGVGERSWAYQTCTEYGFDQVAYHDPMLSARSPLLNIDFQNKMCGKIFGLPPLSVSKIDNDFYKPLLNPRITSRIVFTNGYDDPWSKVSITAENENNTNPNTDIFSIKGEAHCSDLGPLASSGPIKDAQDFFQSKLEQWLQ